MATAVAEQGPAQTARTISTIAARRGVVAGLGVAGLLVAVGGAPSPRDERPSRRSDCVRHPDRRDGRGTVAAALYWLVRRPGNRLGSILLALAVATAVMSLQGATQPLLHSMGVAVEPIFFLLAYYAIFAFPDGRLGGPLEQALLAGMALYFLTGFVPYLFFSPVVGAARRSPAAPPTAPRTRS